mgnify:CR=1 FL=1
MNKLTYSLVCLLVLLLSGSSVLSFTYYVSSTGADSNPGTSEAPFLSIQKAADVVEPGDSVIVDMGVYTDTNLDDYTVYLNRGGTAEQGIVFLARNRGDAVLDGQSNTTGYGWNFGEKANYIRVENFELKGFKWGGFWSNAGAHHIYIKNNIIHDIGRRCTDSAYGQVGVYQGIGTSYHTYDGNTIYNIGRFANGENGCTNGNAYWTNHDHGLYIQGDHVVIINNVFYNNKAGWDVGVWGNIDFVVSNNTFASRNPNKPGQLILSYGMASIKDVIIQNNLFYQPNHVAITDVPKKARDNVVLRNNLVVGAPLIDDASGLVLQDNIEYYDDPFLENPENYEFQLNANSPAIDSGIASQAPAYDIEGTTRSSEINGAVDIGAYEFVHSGGSTDTTPPVTPQNLRVKYYP